ncbi:MAG: hypothetical protein AAGA99_09490 [Actinomycetota bacterium]
MARIVVAATEATPDAPGSGFIPPCTAEQALELAQAALDDTVRIASSTGHPVTVVLDVTSPLTAPAGAAELRPELDDEDERIAAGLVDGDGPVLVLRARTPQVTEAVVADLLEALDGPYGDAVAALTVDESWWALGLARPEPSALLGLPMRGPGSGTHLLDRLHGLGLALGLGERLLAAETHDDLAPVAEQAATGRFTAAFGTL